ncbi:ubl carboxyl-terminal hydrolase 18 [Eleutherodactylus coqui]|uniref:ubl carboxyl-terminal hydrolase 18 n=1 Tax=Eleutherodactylus coqui TaxID=57060 RepID=UPI00346219C9
MYEDDYVEIQQLESEDSQPAVCKAPPHLKSLSYSTGKFKNGAVGLCNVGVTSCLNPLLHALYMYKEFTDIMCRIGEADDNVPTEKRLPYELLVLFEEMQDSKEDAVPPYRILRCLHVLVGTLFSQMDVGDVFSSFWNHLLQNMPDPQLEEKLRALYAISLEEQVTCHRCRHQRFTHCELKSLPLRVSHSKYHRKLKLEGALWRYFRLKELYEDETFCSKCEENSCARKVIRLCSLPRTLTIHLKRLYKTGSQVQKANGTFSFPLVLDLLEILSPEQLPEDERSTVSWDDVKCAYGNTAFHWGGYS